MFYTCVAGPLDYEAWVCGQLRIALTTPFWADVPEGFETVTVFT